MLSFDDQTHIYTRKTICQHCIGGEGGGGVYAQIVPLKITIEVPNDSLVIFWTVFTSVPTTFDLHCSCSKSFTKKSTLEDFRANVLKLEKENYLQKKTAKRKAEKQNNNNLYVVV